MNHSPIGQPVAMVKLVIPTISVVTGPILKSLTEPLFSISNTLMRPSSLYAERWFIVSLHCDTVTPPPSRIRMNSCWPVPFVFGENWNRHPRDWVTSASLQLSWTYVWWKMTAADWTSVVSMVTKEIWYGFSAAYNLSLKRSPLYIKLHQYYCIVLLLNKAPLFNNNVFEASVYAKQEIANEFIWWLMGEISRWHLIRRWPLLEEVRYTQALFLGGFFYT